MPRGPKTKFRLAECVRQRLARTICTRYRDQDGRLHVVTLDPALEERIRAGFEHDERWAADSPLAPGRRGSVRLDRAEVEKLVADESAADRAGEPRHPPGPETNHRGAHPAT